MFINELSKITGLPLNETFSDYKIVNLAGKALYVQNYIKLVTYLPEKILLKIKNNELEILGQNLVIVELSEKDILVKGSIQSTTLTKGVVNEKN